ncbi:hypothetical protein BY458DRAFT_433409 [Sporodiniella umbellata]|nr:hypothetical protein BY458DRAFT_433409 [Sporodiniella umbellata]
MLGAAFFILIWTTIPVVVKLGYITPWFPGDTLWRLFDPVITLPFNLFILTRAEVMNTGGRPHYWGVLSERSVAWLLWSMAAAHPELVAQYPVLEEMYSNMRDLWEHYIAHYMYAFGAMAMTWVQLFVFRNQVHEPLSKTTKIVWCLGTLVYGLLIAGVAIEFPHGLVVGLIYSIVIGLVTLSMMLFNKRNLPKGGLFTMGKRMVIQYYLGSCIVGFVIIIIWIGKYGLLNRKAAGIA